MVTKLKDGLYVRLSFSQEDHLFRMYVTDKCGTDICVHLVTQLKELGQISVTRDFCDYFKRAILHDPEKYLNGSEAKKRGNFRECCMTAASMYIVERHDTNILEMLSVVDSQAYARLIELYFVKVLDAVYLSSVFKHGEALYQIARGSGGLAVTDYTSRLDGSTEWVSDGCVSHAFCKDVFIMPMDMFDKCMHNDVFLACRHVLAVNIGGDLKRCVVIAKSRSYKLNPQSLASMAKELFRILYPGASKLSIVDTPGGGACIYGIMVDGRVFSTSLDGFFAAMTGKGGLPTQTVYGTGRDFLKAAQTRNMMLQIRE